MSNPPSLPTFASDQTDNRPGIKCSGCGCRHFEKQDREEFGVVFSDIRCRHCGKRYQAPWSGQAKS